MNLFLPIGAFYPSQKGGPCNALYWHSCELQRQGFHVTVVTTMEGIQHGAVATNEFFYSDCGKVYYGTTSARGRLKTLRKAVSQVKRADVIHLNSLFNYHSIVVFFFARFFYPKKPMIWSVRGELSPVALKFSNWKKKPIMWLYKRLVSKVVFHGTSPEEVASIAQNFTRSKTVQIPNLILPTTPISAQVKDQFLYVGRIHPIKALHKIIKGLGLSASFLGSAFSFVMVGKFEERHSSYKKELDHLITELGLQGKVVFKGHLEGEDKERMYAESYMTLLLSESENFGNVVPESLIHGTPVITSQGTPWGMLPKYGCGMHITNDPEDIARAIDKAIQLGKDRYLQMRGLSQRYVDQNLDVRTQIGKWISVYESVLSRDD